MGILEGFSEIVGFLKFLKNSVYLSSNSKILRKIIFLKIKKVFLFSFNF